VPGKDAGTWVIHPEGLAYEDSRRMQVVFTDRAFTEIMGFQIVAGRGFSPEFETDAEAALLNEAAVENIGCKSPEEAIGKIIDLSGIGKKLTVVGVIRDYHQAPLRQAIEPLLFTAAKPRFPPFNHASLRFQAGNLPETLARVEQAWKGLFPGYAFDYFFLDEHFDEQYRTEEQLATMLGVFAALAILIGCLGLFGLAAFMATQRKKEIGVRKVLGASVGSIVALLSKDFLKLVLIGFVVAAPLAYFGMSRWLEDFAYRIEIGPGIFVLAGMLAVLIALLTVSYQAVKAALSDPVKSLRYE
jgi:putative ABC transport system permease protein